MDYNQAKPSRRWRWWIGSDDCFKNDFRLNPDRSVGEIGRRWLSAVVESGYLMSKCLIACLLLAGICLHAQPGGPDEPVRVRNGGIDLSVHDGRLRPAIGVESIQVIRANRTRPETADNYGWTYNHAPMLAYWNGKFHLQYLSNPFAEHLPPGQTLVAVSSDGRNWEQPRPVFPIYHVRPGPTSSIESGIAMMHQRMGFYVAPNGRLLVLGFYGRAPNFSGANGIGRVVREAYRDGTYGPIHFIRYNSLSDHNESNTSHPSYTRSGDPGFIDACNALLADKLKTMQWWDEERNSDDPFFTLRGPSSPSVYHRRDGKAVALFKASWAAVSSDEGLSWSSPVQVPTIITDGAKTWGQRTEDGRYAIVYNPANFGSHRWPLAIATGDDGIVFEDMLLVSGEVPPLRYRGRAKDFGLQYVRGITEGSGDPPGSDLWVTYSVNKEDMWVSRVQVPVRSKVAGPVEDRFDQLGVGAVVPDWNLYRPRWADTKVTAFPSARNKSLQLSDSDPYDYAKAVRVFAESRTVQISLRLLARQTETGRLEIEILDPAGHRPIRVVLSGGGRLQTTNGDALIDAGRYRAGVWHHIEFAVDAGEGRYDLSVDGEHVVRQAAFAEAVTSVERLSFRTGEYRTTPTRETDRYAGFDLPGGDVPVTPAVYHIDDVLIR
jgi:hypothetical protein